MKGSLGGLITSSQSRQAGLREEGRAWGLGRACAEPCPRQSCPRRSQLSSWPSTPPGLWFSSLRDLCPGRPFWELGLSRWFWGWRPLGGRAWSRGKEPSGSAFSASHPQDLRPALCCNSSPPRTFFC